MSSRLPWPEIQQGYDDAFGPIDPEVYKAAGAIWPLAQAQIIRVLGDLDVGQQLMLKSVAIASRKFAQDPARMTSLKGYILVIFNHLLSKEVGKEAGHSRIETQLGKTASSPIDRPEDEIERVILIHELIARADEWTRKIFEELILGYTFEELAPRYYLKPNVLRARWSKKMRRLREQIRKEETEAREKILRRSVNAL
jgi:hypothetical protein